MCLLQENPPEADLGGWVHTEQGEVPGGSGVPFRVTSFFHQEDVVRGWVKLPPVGTKLFNRSSQSGHWVEEEQPDFTNAGKHRPGQLRDACLSWDQLSSLKPAEARPRDPTSTRKLSKC